MWGLATFNNTWMRMKKIEQLYITSVIFNESLKKKKKLNSYWWREQPKAFDREKHAHCMNMHYSLYRTKNSSYCKIKIMQIYLLMYKNTTASKIISFRVSCLWNQESFKAKASWNFCCCSCQLLKTVMKFMAHQDTSLQDVICLIRWH